MEDEKKTSEPVRPKDQRNWDPSGCPWFIFGDEDSAQYDLEKMKKFFQRKFGKKNHGCKNI